MTLTKELAKVTYLLSPSSLISHFQMRKKIWERQKEGKVTVSIEYNKDFLVCLSHPINHQVIQSFHAIICEVSGISTVSTLMF